MTTKVFIKKTAVLTGILAVMFFSACTSEEEIAMMEEYLNRDTMFNGISVGGVDVSGMGYDEALAEVAEYYNTDKETVTVAIGEKEWILDFEDADAGYDYKSAVDEAFSIGRDGDLKDRYKDAVKAEEEGVNLSAVYSYDENKVNEFVMDMKTEADASVKDSVVLKENERIVITDEVYGIDVDETATADLVKAVLETGKSDEVEAVYTSIEPEIKKADNEKNFTIIGSYTTTFSRGYINRNINLDVGCKYINGTVLQPGEEFSMAEGLKEQTYENGYRNAAVFVNGKSEDGMGGGVCQISTTVYNAVIRAELKVTERFNHSVPVSYVPLGLDAAIAEGYKDFKFVNDTEYPVYIEAYIDDNKLISNIYGTEIHEPGREVDFQSVYISSVPKPAEKVTEDPELFEDYREVTYEGSIGHIVEIYKKVSMNGELVSREFFSKSSYRPVPDEVTVGTKPVIGESEVVIPFPEIVEPVPEEDEEATQGLVETVYDNTDELTENEEDYVIGEDEYVPIIGIE